MGGTISDSQGGIFFRSCEAMTRISREWVNMLAWLGTNVLKDTILSKKLYDGCHDRGVGDKIAPYLVFPNRRCKCCWNRTTCHTVQFSLIFQMVYSVLPPVLHFKTSLLVDPDWLLKVFHQSGVGVSKGNTASKMEHSTWKSNENWPENWCQIACSVLFEQF